VLAKTAVRVLGDQPSILAGVVMSLKTPRRPKTRKALSTADKLRGAEKRDGANSTAGVVKYPEEAVKQWVLESQALLEPGQFDHVKAGRLKMEVDVMMLAIQRATPEEEHAKAGEKEFFDWLEANIPELFNIQGRPHWIESAEIMSNDKALLDNFNERLNRNVAAHAGKKHGASKKTYFDLADEYGVEDAETVKRRVMRARRRQKALQETTRDLIAILGRAKRRGDRDVSPEEAKRNRKKLLKALRRISRGR
jgi:hypothetical protein